MAKAAGSATVRGAADLQLDHAVLRVLRERLPAIATTTVAAVVDEVPDYRGALGGVAGDTIERAVQMAIAGFLKLAGGRDVDASTPLGPTREGAYALGRGEARGGRSMDSLLAAYRVGARVSWRELARAAAEAGLPATTMAKFAELLFAYIDELSAASVAGHTDELTTSGRVRDRYRERLGQHLLAGAGVDVLTAAAARAEWAVPVSLTAVLLPAAEARRALASLGTDALQLGEDLQGLEHVDPDHPLTLLLVPDADGPGRLHLLRVLAGRHAVVGPPRPWAEARSSYDRAARTVGVARLDAHGGPGRHRGAPGRPRPHRRPGGLGRPARPRAGAPGRTRTGHPGPARRDAPVVAAAPGTPRRGRRRAAHPRPDGALPDGPGARALR